MAVAARALTLPAVVEELLSEMAAAARDGAPSTGWRLMRRRRRGRKPGVPGRGCWPLRGRFLLTSSVALPSQNLCSL